MQVALTALGCRLNEAELERWAAGFQAAGHRLAQRMEEADLVVVNTCAVTGEAVKKSRQLLRRARRRNAQAKLVVSGCYATLQPEIQQDEDIDLLVSNADKERLVDIVRQKLALEAAPDAAARAPAAALFARGRNRAFVKAQDGCRHQCAFCIVTIARGAERSRPIEDIVAEIKGLRRQGIREAVLTGVHLGGYGRDLKTDLPALIERVLAETTLPRLRLGSVEPWDLNERFFSLFDNPRFMPHLHLPLQSGSDAVLRRMGRRCRSAAFAALAQAARERVPAMNLTTDVIAGFPGETDEEWRQTMAFCHRLGFSHIHVFPYSPRAGTRAAGMPDQTPAEVKQRRCRQLQALARQLRRDFARRWVGRSFPVLVEDATGEINGAAMRFGYSPNYLRVALPATGTKAPRPNEIAATRVVDYNEAAGVLVAARG